MKSLTSLLVLSFVALALSATKAVFSASNDAVTLGTDSLTVNNVLGSSDLTVSWSKTPAGSKCIYPDDDEFVYSSSLKTATYDFDDLTEFVDNCNLQMEISDSDPNYKIFSNDIIVTRNTATKSIITTPVSVMYPKNYVQTASVKVKKTGSISFDATVQQVQFSEGKWNIILAIDSTTSSYDLSIVTTNTITGFTVTNPTIAPTDTPGKQTISFSLTKNTSPACTYVDINSDNLFTVAGSCRPGQTECTTVTDPPTAQVGLTLTTGDACPVTQTFAKFTKSVVSAYAASADGESKTGTAKKIFGKTESIYFESVFDNIPAGVQISGSVTKVCLTPGTTSDICSTPITFNDAEGETANIVGFSVSAEALSNLDAVTEVTVRIEYSLVFSSSKKRSVHLPTAVHSIIITGDSSGSSTLMMYPFVMALIFAFLA